MSLLDYWEEHPPLYILVQGIASGMAGKHIGRESKTDNKPAATTKHIESAEELFGIVSGSGITIGVIHQLKADNGAGHVN